MRRALLACPEKRGPRALRVFRGIHTPSPGASFCSTSRLMQVLLAIDPVSGVQTNKECRERWAPAFKEHECPITRRRAAYDLLNIMRGLSELPSKKFLLYHSSVRRWRAISGIIGRITNTCGQFTSINPLRHWTAGDGIGAQMQICKFASLKPSFHFIRRRLGNNYRYVIPLVDNGTRHNSNQTARICCIFSLQHNRPFAGGRIEQFLMFRRGAACLGVQRPSPRRLSVLPSHTHHAHYILLGSR